MFARIAGVGSYLPGSPVSNADLVARGVDTNDDWVICCTGIKTRHFAQAGVTSSDLAFEACRRALASAGKAASDIDLIIVATSTPDAIFPSTACLLQAKLGDRGAMAKTIATVERHGNSSAASIPLALGAAVLDGRVQRGHKLLLEGIGGGFTWDAVLLQF